MVTDEANSKNGESLARITTWVNTFKSCAEIVNAKFGTSISAKINFIDEEETGKEGDMNELCKNHFNWLISVVKCREY